MGINEPILGHIEGFCSYKKSYIIHTDPDQHFISFTIEGFILVPIDLIKGFREISIPQVASRRRRG